MWVNTILVTAQIDSISVTDLIPLLLALASTSEDSLSCEPNAGELPASNAGILHFWYLPVVVADGGSFCFSGD
uniref:Uncharacterized protein n=1 Tax=Hyaloperonospora arabidopsidis (strain Emoy2) TaxID=559515 RepID=M4C1C7_HYAAE